MEARVASDLAAGVVRAATDATADGPLEVLWHDDAAPARARRSHALRGAVDRAVAERAALGLDAEPEDHVRAILQCAGASADLAPGAIVVLRGEMEFTHDSASALRDEMELARQFPKDARLAELAERAARVAEVPGAATTGLLDDAGRALREALVAAGARATPKVDVAVCLDGAALEARSFARRRVLGEAHVLGALTVRGSAGKAIVVYLPERVAAYLPALARFEASVFGVVVFPHTPNEPSPVALRAFALGRTR
jgi:hypothetical protein